MNYLTPKDLECVVLHKDDDGNLSSILSYFRHEFRTCDLFLLVNRLLDFSPSSWKAIDLEHYLRSFHQSNEIFVRVFRTLSATSALSQKEIDDLRDFLLRTMEWEFRGFADSLIVLLAKRGVLNVEKALLPVLEKMDSVWKVEEVLRPLIACCPSAVPDHLLSKFTNKGSRRLDFFVAICRYFALPQLKQITDLRGEFQRWTNAETQLQLELILDLNWICLHKEDRSALRLYHYTILETGDFRNVRMILCRFGRPREDEDYTLLKKLSLCRDQDAAKLATLLLEEH